MDNEFEKDLKQENMADWKETPIAEQPEETPKAEEPAAEQPAPAAEQETPATQPAAAEQPAPQAEPQPSRNAYPNVGSSGLNTANTARTEYSGAQQPNYQQPNPGYNRYQYNGGYQGYQQQSPNGYYQQNPGYGYQQQPGQRGYTGAYTGTGYAYTQNTENAANTAPNGSPYTADQGAQQPRRPAAPRAKARKQSSGKKTALRLLSLLLVVALSFVSGLAGAVAANRMGLITGRGQMVVQSVERLPEASSQGSSAGSALSIQDVAAIVSPSVVVITTEQMVSSNAWFGSYVQSGAGSGVIMSADGYILTCAHVVDGASAVKVQLNGDEDANYTATVVGSDSKSDIAVIKIEANNLTPAVMGDSDALAVGETVVAVGNPLGTLGGTVTNGIVSALNRQIEVEGTNMTLIQTNTAISPGNSGGGLFNAAGELVGIVNAKSAATSSEGLSFAIPVNNAVNIASELLDSGYVKRPVLGVTVIDVTDANTAMQYGVSSLGVYINSVTEGKGAAQAGVKAGDRIVAIGDTVVSNVNALTEYLAGCEVGQVVVLQVEREGKLLSFEVTLTESEG